MAAANTRVSAKKSDDTAGAATGDDSGRAKRGSSAKRTPRTSAQASGQTSARAGETAKKPTKHASTTAKSTGTNNRATTNRGRNTPRPAAAVQPSTSPRKVTMGSPTRATSLRSDLQKHKKERYAPEDFMQGSQLIIEAGFGGTLRDLVASVLRSQGAFGNMQSEHAMEGLLDLLTDGYRKRKAAERKGIRAVLNWCSGLAEPDPTIEGELLAMVLAQGNPGG